MSDYIDFGSMSVQELSRHLEQTLIKVESMGGLAPKVQYQTNDARFAGVHTATISVPFINSQRGRVVESYQNTLEKVHLVISPVMDAMRAQGVTFTQPAANSAKAWATEAHFGGELIFTVAASTTLGKVKTLGEGVLDDLLGEGAGTMGVLTMRFAEREIAEPIVSVDDITGPT